MVPYAVEARRILEEKGISTGLIDMYCLKPFDRETLLQAAGRTGCFVTVEEHAPHGGLGSLVCQALSQNIPKRVLQLALPDGHIIPCLLYTSFRRTDLQRQMKLRLRCCSCPAMSPI